MSSHCRKRNARTKDFRTRTSKRSASGTPILWVLGDYNIAPEDRDVHDPKAWEGQIHVSEPERVELRALTELGLTDVYRRFAQSEKSFSWWDYRMFAFRRNRGCASTCCWRALR